ncbi:MAG: V-type ATP synthase subunit D [Clostridia bacterium]|nr:V-type ATP synthase subunit D [Clostridia bacterium]
MPSQVFPTKNNLIATKKSLNLAKLGYDLMDRKRNILVREMMEKLDNVKTLQSDVYAAYSQAYSLLRQAHLTMGSCTEYANCIPVDNSLDISVYSVMGVELPKIKLGKSETNFYYGLESTNSLLDEAYIKFNEAKELTMQLAEIQSGVIRLADAIKKTQKRTNALSNIMIPKFTATVKFISDALDEKEREDFSRLKVIKKTKE